jgi:Arc/MetJ-type ribon-helix-helix transcriptional regulator
VVHPKRRTVVNADAAQLADVEALVERGLYGSVSEFVRQAMADKLAQLRQGRLAEAVAAYCAAGHAVEDLDLLEGQALDQRPARPAAQRRTKARRRRAAR